MRKSRVWNSRVLVPSRAAMPLMSGVRAEVTIRRRPMKEFYCGAIIHGCEARLAAPSEEELLSVAHAHAWSDHGIADVSPRILEEIRHGARTVGHATTVSVSDGS